jgi:hypothetical protein
MAPKPSRDWLAILLVAQERGIHAAQVAREQGVSDVCIHKYARRFRVNLVKMRPGRPSLNWDDALRDAKKRGLTIIDLASEMGVSKAAVSKQAHKRGIFLKGQFPEPQARAA